RRHAGGEVKNYDPTQISDSTSSKAFGLIYESLLGVDFQGAPRPVLATSFEQQDDLLWRATLREGVTFHDGTELTAEDVQASYERYRGTSRESMVFQWYESSTVVDDYTLDITLNGTYTPLKYAVASVPIVPAAVSAGTLDLNTTPVGTGPYAFAEHEPSDLFRITRYEDYWFGGDEVVPDRPPIDTVTFRIIVEESSQLAALQSGEVDMINTVPEGSYQDLQNDETYTLTERTEGDFTMVIFPMGLAPFDNRKVRRGVSRLVPRQAIVDSVYDGIGVPAWSPISPLAGQFTSLEFNERMGEQYTAYDLERATQLLEEGFAEAGVSAPFETKILTSQSTDSMQISQVLQQSLNSTDFFEVEIDQVEPTTRNSIALASDSHTRNYLIPLGWSGGWDPDAYVNNLFYSSRATPNCCNIPHYKNEDVDALIEQGLQTYDLAERKEIYQQLIELICRDSPMAFVRFGKALDAVRAGTVNGFATYPIDGGEFTGIYAPYAEKFTWLDK
ncbi:MAG: ABC transporter substrate-binding protein, partial [Halobacteriota archaeon]